MTQTTAPAEPAAPRPPRTLPAPLRRLRDLTAPPRIMGVDVARGIAVVGMIGAHVGITETFDWARIETWTDVVHGRSSLLFALVAGISIALLSGGMRRPSVEDLPALRLRLVGRGAVVFAIGVALELLGTGIAVILTVYGILFVAIIPFLRWRRRSLWIGAGAFALLGPVVLELARTLSLFAFGPGIDLVLFGMYPITVWMAFLLAGLAIGRTDLLRIRTAVALLLGGAVLAGAGYGVATLVGSSSTGFGSSPSSSSSWVDVGIVDTVPPSEVGGDLVCDVYDDGTAYCYPADSAMPSGSGLGSGESVVVVDDWEESSYGEMLDLGGLPDRLLAALTDVAPHSGGTLEILGSGGLAAAIVGASLLLTRPLRWLLLPIAALGSMPLTAYSAHVVVILLNGGLVAAYLMEGTLWPILAITLLVAATAWVALLGAGPLERLARLSATAMAGKAAAARLTVGATASDADGHEPVADAEAAPRP